VTALPLAENRGFRLLWAAETISRFVTRTVLPLLAVTALAAGPFEMGLLSMATTIAFLLIGLPAGAWVDRIRRLPLMMYTDVARGALVLSVYLAWWTGLLTFPYLVIVALAVSIATVFYDIAYQSYLPHLLSREHLPAGNARLQASQSVTQVAAPALGGGLVQLVGAAAAMIPIGVSHLASALLLRKISTAEPEPARNDSRRLRTEIAEGLRFVLTTPTIRAVALFGTVSGFFISMKVAMQVLFLATDVGLTAAQVGGILVTTGIAGVAGAATSRPWFRAFGQIRSIWLAPATTLPFGLLLPMTYPGLAVLLAVPALFLPFYGITVHNIAQVSYRQTICPDHLLGRMNGTMRFLIWGIMPARWPRASSANGSASARHSGLQGSEPPAPCHG
jgi:MFS family permease